MKHCAQLTFERANNDLHDQMPLKHHEKRRKLDYHKYYNKKLLV